MNNTRQARDQLAKAIAALINSGGPISQGQQTRIVNLFGQLPMSQRRNLWEAINSEALPSEVVTKVIGIHLNAVAIAADRLGISTQELFNAGKAQLERQTPDELNAMCKQILERQQHG